MPRQKSAHLCKTSTGPGRNWLERKPTSSKFRRQSKRAPMPPAEFRTKSSRMNWHVQRMRSTGYCKRRAGGKLKRMRPYESSRRSPIAILSRSRRSLRLHWTTSQRHGMSLSLRKTRFQIWKRKWRKTRQTPTMLQVSRHSSPRLATSYRPRNAKLSACKPTSSRPRRRSTTCGTAVTAWRRITALLKMRLRTLPSTTMRNWTILRTKYRIPEESSNVKARMWRLWANKCPSCRVSWTVPSPEWKYWRDK
mmetsp:Transcript_13875/g.39888  ORF Transcript_13875/g.39888 Transcript_13875/m.39888 type:complete len:250 (-) Transcript_13875:3849-4598(-)